MHKILRFLMECLEYLLINNSFVSNIKPLVSRRDILTQDEVRKINVNMYRYNIHHSSPV